MDNNKEAHRRAVRKYQKTAKGKAAQKRYRQTEKGRLAACRRATKRKITKYHSSIKGKAARERFLSLHPNYIKVKSIVNNAIQSGKIQKASFYKCGCGKQAQQYHHPDYNKPLYVLPVCRICHYKYDRRIA